MDTMKLSNWSLRYQNIDLNTKDIYGGTPFMNACNNGHIDVIKSANQLISMPKIIHEYEC